MPTAQALGLLKPNPPGFQPVGLSQPMAATGTSGNERS